MAKNLLICFDGTWSQGAHNESDEKTREGTTNVWRLFQQATGACGAVYQQGKGPSSSYDAAQIAWYDAGVGTAWYERLRGGIFGYGLDKNIMQGYAVLAELYEEGDRIFLCGFSRGAYTARSLAGLIALCGLVNRQNVGHTEEVLEPTDFPKTCTKASPKACTNCPPVFAYEEALALYRAIGASKAQTKQDGTLKQRLAAFRKQSRSVAIECIAVWDTVKALGLPSSLVKWLPFGLGTRYNEAHYGFHDHTLSPIVGHGYHALALDEHRQDFAPILWDDVNACDTNKKVFDTQIDTNNNLPISEHSISEKSPTSPPQNIEQRWFCGSHSDIGGGYANSTLSDQSLTWMRSKLVDCGLLVERVHRDTEEEAAMSTCSNVPYAPPILASINDSFRDFYTLTHRFRTRHIRSVHAENSTVTLDPSVLERMVFDASYRPQNVGLGDLLEHMTDSI